MLYYWKQNLIYFLYTVVGRPASSSNLHTVTSVVIMKNTIELKYKLYLTTYPQYKLFQHVIFLLHTITILVFQLTSPNSYKAKYYFHIFSE